MDDCCPSDLGGSAGRALGVALLAHAAAQQRGFRSVLTVAFVMKVLNVHERELPESAQRVGALIDTLASSEDALWPRQCWPPIAFDRPLGIGAVGGHGPIRYFVEAYRPGRSVKFRFTAPRGFDGRHGYEVERCGTQSCVLRHTLQMSVRGPAIISWPMVFRPLHDALIEDSLCAAQASLGHVPDLQRWSGWVRILRFALSKGRARAQRIHNGVASSIAWR